MNEQKNEALKRVSDTQADYERVKKDFAQLEDKKEAAMQELKSQHQNEIQKYKQGRELDQSLIENLKREITQLNPQPESTSIYQVVTCDVKTSMRTNKRRNIYESAPRYRPRNWSTTQLPSLIGTPMIKKNALKK